MTHPRRPLSDPLRRLLVVLADGGTTLDAWDEHPDVLCRGVDAYRMFRRTVTAARAAGLVDDAGITAAGREALASGWRDCTRT